MIPVILAAASLATSLYGNYKASKASKAAANAKQQALDENERRNEDFYNKRMNEDYTQRSDSQAAITRAREYANEYSQKAAGRSAVMGSSDAAAAQAKSVGSKMVGDVTSNIASAASDYKQNAEDNYLSNAQRITGERGNVLANQYNTQAQNIAGATGNVGNAIGGYVNNYYNNKLGNVGSSTTPTTGIATGATSTYSGGIGDSSRYFPDYKSQFSTTNATMQ